MSKELLRWQLLCHCIQNREADGRALRFSGKRVVLFRSREDTTANVKVAVESCIELELLAPHPVPGWQWPDFVLTPAGEAVARGPEPEWKPTPPKLTKRDTDLLFELSEKWRTPMMLGAGNGSYHSNSLRKLCENGLAESSGRQYPTKPSIYARRRGSQRYRITKKGLAAKEVDPEIANTLAIVMADVPDACSIDTVAMQDAAQVVWMVQLELDLIEEGQDGTDEYTKKDIQEIYRFLKRYKDMLPNNIKR